MHSINTMEKVGGILAVKNSTIFKKYLDFKRHVKYFDIFLFALVILISLFGIIMISSATSNFANRNNFIITQFLSLIIGLFLMFITIYIDYNDIGRAYKIIYVFSLLLLVGVFFLGTGQDQWGAQRWIRIGGIGIQPSEIVKIGFILAFAKYLELIKDNINKLSYLLSVMIFVGLPTVLVMRQPDLGTALAFVFISLVMLFICGISYKYVLGGLFSLVILIPIAWHHLLKPYQQNRLLVFLNPDTDPLGSGFHVLQSKLSIGSGSLFGRGLFNGTYTRGFLPEKHTDFIFSVIGEELGFVGSIAVLILLLVIVYRCFTLAKTAKDNLGSFICVGVASMLLFQIFQNIGMTVGVMPVTGIPLPFVSYGGSSLITNFIAIGLVLNVRMRNKSLIF
jgi:rod shape determining protein RodA